MVEKSTSVEVGSVATLSGTDIKELKYNSSLEASKEYVVTVSASDGSNAKFYQIKLTGASSSTPTTYPITYDLNGGEGTVPTGGAEAEGATFALAKADGINRMGYTFAGWNDGTATYQPDDSYIMPGSAVAFKAQWTPITYNITYEGVTKEENNPNNPSTYTIESETITFQEPAARDGYIFDGWSPASIIKGTIGEQTITAQWTPKPANVFTFSYGEKDKAYQTVEFTQVGTTNEWQIKHFVFPDVNTNQACYVGVNGYWYNDGGLGSNNAKSADLYFWNMPLALLQTDNACSVCNQLNWDMNSSDGHKAIGTLRIFDNYSDDNLFVGFVPDGYGLMFGKENEAWSSLAFAEEAGDVWTTTLTELTAEMTNGTFRYYVGLLTSDNAYTYCGNSATSGMKDMGVFYSEGWHNNLNQFGAGQRGKFRIWANSCNGNGTKNFVCHFVPYYGLCYNANYPAGVSETAPADTWSDFVSVEESRTLTLAAAPVAPAGYIFKGWTTAQDGTGDLLNPGGDYALNNPVANTTLYAQWEEKPFEPECNLYLYFPNATDATNAGVTNTDRFTGTAKDNSNLLGSIKINETTYQATRRTGNSGHKISFTVQSGNIATLYLLAASSGSGERSFSLSKDDAAAEPTGKSVSGSSFTSVEIPSLSAGKYTLTASGNWAYGLLGLHECTALPDAATPEITTQPQSATYCAGETIAALSVEARVTDGGTLSYQWKNGDTDIENATSDSYTPTATGTGTYVCVVTNTKNGCSPVSVVSNAATVTVKALPKITKQPQSVECFAGTEVTFTVEASDAESFQWYTYNAAGEAEAISGATEATYRFTPTEAVTTKYYVVALNSCGSSAKSDEVTLTATVEPSCGLLIKVTLPDKTNVEGIYAGTADLDVQTRDPVNGGYKLGKDGHFVSLTLKDGKSFAEGDEVIVEVTQISQKLQIFADQGTTPLVETSSVVVGENRLILPDAANGLQMVYLYRTATAGSTMNPFVKSMAVERLCCTRPKLSYGVSEFEYPLNSSAELPNLINPYTVSVSRYESSNPEVATVDAAGAVTVIGQGTTTISAVFDGDDTYCATTASYVLTVTCGDDVPQIAPEEGSVSCTAVELRLLQSDGTTPVSSGNVQWYRDGVAIEGATGYTYTATTAGEYTATLEQTCTVTTSNKAVIASTITPPDIKAFSPFRTHQITGREVDGVPVRPYSADTHYPLFTLKPTLPDDGTKLCRFTLVVRNGNNVRYAISTPTDNDELDWIRRDSTFRDDTIHIGANYPKLGEWIRNYNETHTDNPFVVGDTIWLTAHPLNACGEYDMDVTATIPIKLTDKFSIAYIITGDDGGSFYEINQDNLGAFYQQFREFYYEITPVNAYAPYDYYYYEPYDLVMLTDYPKATGKDAKPERVDALADLVDRKPMLSFKAHMADKALPKWKEVGFAASPKVPDAEQTKIQLLCSDHPIFEGEEIGQVEILSQGNSNKGLQGFSELGMDGFVNIATVDGGKQGTLVACCERQDVVEARLVVLSIYSGATQYITATGMQAVDNVLEYLLQTDETKLSDCSIIFNDATGDKQWTTAANWQGGNVPNRLQNVRIEADCEVSGGELQIISNVNINNKYRLTIKPDGALGSLGKFSVYSDENKTYSYITDPGYVTIEADETATGALLHTHHTRPLVATVQLYSKAHIEMVDGKKKNYWAYVGIPVQEAPVPQFFNGAYTWQYDETNPNVWTRYGNGTTMTAFEGYGLSQPAPQLFTLTGQLVYAQDRVVTLTKTAGAGEGQNLIGNSWTAPIQITLLEATDFGEGLEPTVYIYNTGRDAESGVGGYGGVDVATPGQWRTIPIETAKLEGYAGPKTIPAMQAFEVDFSKDATQTTANLTLEYNRVVRTSKGTDLNMPLYAPRRKAQAVTDEPELMRICVEDSRTRTDLYLLQDGRFTDGFDNGWDGYFIKGDGRSAGLWAYSPIGDMAVSAQPAIDGTTLGFVPGRENQYTFSFQWEGETLYLNDMLLQHSTQIQTGNTYVFTAFEGDMENRFVVSHEPYQVTTSLTDVILTGDVLTLSNPAGEMLDVLVYDPAGRICTIRQTADNLVKLDLPATQGVYMVCVRTTDGNKVYKVVR
ncbi:MAG: InlB B-repeat-containing protein [Paludibacteraceae bacterium]